MRMWQSCFFALGLAVAVGCGAKHEEANKATAQKTEAVTAPQNDPKPIEGIRWVNSLKEGKALSRTTGKPIFVDFMADWCTYCKRLDQDSYVQPRVIDLSRNFVMVKSDTDHEGKQDAIHYNITGLPTILVMDADGEVMAKTSYAPPDDFYNNFKLISDGVLDMKSAEAALKKNPRDKAALATKCNVLAAFGNGLKLRSALMDATKAGVNAKELSASYMMMGKIMMNQQKLSEAQTYFTIVADSAENPEAKNDGRIFLCMALGQSKQFAKTLPVLKQVLEDPGANPLQKQTAEKLKDAAEHLIAEPKKG